MTKIENIRYGFEVSVLITADGDKRIYHSISSKEYPMLSHLSTVKEEAVRQIIGSLENVIAGRLEEYGPWGEDFCMIRSTKETSHLEYYEYSDDNHWISGLIADMPTSTLLLIMRDWLIFLTNNPRQGYTTNVTTPNV